MGSGEYVPPNSFQCDSISWWLHAGMAPTHRVAMDTSLPAMNLVKLPPNLQARSQAIWAMSLKMTPYFSITLGTN